MLGGSWNWMATIGHRDNPLAYASIAHRKPPAGMRGLLDLVRQGYGVVLERDAAALVVAEQLVATKAEFSGALTRHEHRRRRQEGPVKRGFLAQQVQKGAAGRGLGLVERRKLRGVDQPDAGCDLEAAGAADHEIARHAGGMDRLDQLLRVAGGEMD